MIVKSFSLCDLTNTHKTPSGATTIAVVVCPKCGTIEKSGKMSCCGHGGSWFRNCGGAVSTKLHHTWYEGIQTCKARPQFNVVIKKYFNTTHEKDIGSSSDGAHMTNFKSVFTIAKSFTLTSFSRTVSNDPDHTSVNTPMITPGCKKLLNFDLFYIGVLLIIVN